MTDQSVAYPLKWPRDRERTPDRLREESRFSVNLGTAADELHAEIERLGGAHIVISTNMSRNRRGELPTDYKRKQAPADPGAAAYFTLNGEPHCFSCDQWTVVEDNIRAIGKTVEAMRGIRRWGSSAAMKQAMSGFKALPPSGDDWRATFGLTRGEPDMATVKARYRELARGAHPDKSGDPHHMVRLNQALEAAKSEMGER